MARTSFGDYMVSAGRRRFRWEWWSLGLQLPALVFLGLAYALPLAAMIVRSVTQNGFSLANYQTVLRDPYQWIILGETLLLAGQVALACAFLGFPVAYVMLKSSRRVCAVIAIIAVLPLWISSLVRAYAWIVVLGRNGLINKLLLNFGVIDTPLPTIFNHFSVFVGMVHYMLPLLIFPLYSAMQRVDLRLINGAASLGAGPLTSFLLVFLPLCIPGVAAGMLLVFVLSIGFFVTPALLGGSSDVTYVMLIEQQVNQNLNWAIASVMSVILLVTTIALVALFQRIFGVRLNSSSQRVGTAGGGAVRLGAIAIGQMNRTAGRLLRRLSPMRFSHEPRIRHVRSPDIAAPVRAVAWAVVLFLVLPVAVLLPLSFGGAPYLEIPPSRWSFIWYRTYFSRADWVDPTIISFQVAGITAVLATVIGTLAAIGLVRGTHWLNSYLRAFFVSPMIAPILVVAVAVYFQLAAIQLAGTRIGLVIGHLVISVPVVIVVIIGALERIDPWPERAARSLGASPVTAFIKITEPQIRAALVSAAAFAFLTSFDDVVMALFISGPRTATLPKRMWDSLHFGNDLTLMAVSMVMVGLTLGLFFGSRLVTAFFDERSRRNVSAKEKSALANNPARTLGVLEFDSAGRR